MHGSTEAAPDAKMANQKVATLRKWQLSGRKWYPCINGSSAVERGNIDVIRSRKRAHASRRSKQMMLHRLLCSMGGVQGSTGIPDEGKFPPFSRRELNSLSFPVS